MAEEVFMESRSEGVMHVRIYAEVVRDLDRNIVSAVFLRAEFESLDGTRAQKGRLDDVDQNVPPGQTRTVTAAQRPTINPFAMNLVL